MMAGKEPLAIVGIGCRFPGGITDPRSFWRVVVSGTDAISEIPGDRADLAGWYDPRPATPGRIMSRRGGFLDRIDQFDAAFFEISPREAARLDPQQRLLLETSWEALEDAGIDARALEGSRTGVFVGQWASDYEAAMFSHPAELDFFSTQGSGRYAASGRISYALGLRGPALTVDTACSSSLVAVHLACRSLREGECDLALVAGVNVITQPHITIAYSQSRMMAPDGRCKFGDASADGYVRAEGAGVVAAQVAHAGARRRRPGVRGDSRQRRQQRWPQQRIAGAPRPAGPGGGACGPHTRTPGLCRLTSATSRRTAPAREPVIRSSSPRSAPCSARARSPASAVPGRVGEDQLWTHRGCRGHCRAHQGGARPAARGRAAKPPLRDAEPGDSVDRAAVPDAAARDAACGGRRRCAHRGRELVRDLRARTRTWCWRTAPVAREPHERAASPRACLLPLSARSPGGAGGTRRRLCRAARLVAPPALQDVCASAALHRTPLEHRAVFVAETTTGTRGPAPAISRQGDPTAAQAIGVASDVRPRRLAFVFPGQGAQWVGMARELLRA